MMGKERMYVVADPQASEPIASGPDSQIFLADAHGIRGPYTTFTMPGGEARGFRVIRKIEADPTVSLHEIASVFGFSTFPELPDYLKAVVMLARGKEDDAAFYLERVQEQGVSLEYLHQIRLMGEGLRCP